LIFGDFLTWLNYVKLCPVWTSEKSTYRQVQCSIFLTCLNHKNLRGSSQIGWVVEAPGHWGSFQNDPRDSGRF
jgi:hypothetical protein